MECSLLWLGSDISMVPNVRVLFIVYYQLPFVNIFYAILLAIFHFLCSQSRLKYQNQVSALCYSFPDIHNYSCYVPCTVLPIYVRNYLGDWEPFLFPSLWFPCLTRSVIPTSLVMRWRTNLSLPFLLSDGPLVTFFVVIPPFPTGTAAQVVSIGQHRLRGLVICCALCSGSPSPLHKMGWSVLP